jgi:hypothetical protein
VAFKYKEPLKTKSNVYWVVEEKPQKSCLSSYTTNVREGSPNLAISDKGPLKMIHVTNCLLKIRLLKKELPKLQKRKITSIGDWETIIGEQTY